MRHKFEPMTRNLSRGTEHDDDFVRNVNVEYFVKIQRNKGFLEHNRALNVLTDTTWALLELTKSALLRMAPGDEKRLICE